MSAPGDTKTDVPGVAERRARYRRTGITADDLDPNPFTQFKAWYDEWAGTNPYDPAAAVLATADAARRPSARYIDLAYVDHGLVFFSDHGSRKGTDIAVNPQAALCFGWLELARQVRVSGAVARLTELESDTYYGMLPRNLQLLVWASNQSRPIPDHAATERRVAEVKARFAGQEVPRSNHWGGYRLVPEQFEFWQERSDGIQDRFRYQRPGPDEPWTRERLAP